MDLLTLYGILNKSSGGDASTVIANILNEVFDTEEYSGKTLEELKTIIADLSSSGSGEINENVVSVPFNYTEDGVTTKYEFTKDTNGNPIIKEVG